MTGSTHPEWSYNANIYEVNIRQYTPEGTITSFQSHLPRLKEMGADILWLMPIHPIGELKRKGSMGSYYSVKDYLAVNPEYGSMDDFKSLVNEIHGMGMYIIIDWVANHSAWDNPLTESHPEWYTKDDAGNFVPPVADWSDVIDFNYDNRELWQYMTDAMTFWVRETAVDGFRCDVAEMVPLEFWEEVRVELDKIKSVFMLAEGDVPELHQSAFDMTYDWTLHRIFNDIFNGGKNANDIEEHLKKDKLRYPDHAYRMQFTSNHDENSWNGTVYERLGDGAKVLAVLTATLNGMPLIYSGQEAGLDKRLAFFEKDSIEWREDPSKEIYTELLNLKKNHGALNNGERSGLITRINSDNDASVFAFINEKDGERIFIITNLSDAENSISLQGIAYAGSYIELFSDDQITFVEGAKVALTAWDYKVFVGEK